MQTEPNFHAMSRYQLMKYLEKNFDYRTLLELEKRPVPQFVLDEHREFLKWREQQSQQGQLS